MIVQAVKFIGALFVPGAGIVKANFGSYDTIVFFIQKAKDIIQMFGSFFGSVADIAVGKIQSAAAALQNGLARSLKLVIVFLAKLVKLDGIAATLRETLGKVRDKVDAVIAALAGWIGLMAKKAGKLLAGPDKATAPVREKRLQNSFRNTTIYRRIWW